MNGFSGEDNPRRRGGRSKWTIPIILLMIILVAGSFYLGTVTAYSFAGASSGSYYESMLDGIKDADKYSKLFNIRAALYQYYDGEIDDDALLEGAIKGMTSALKDPYTVFMNSEEYSAFDQQSEGEYVGLGIQVGAKDDRITVISVFADSPAEKAGIVPGDIILQVNDVDVAGSDIDKAVSMMKGDEKIEVKLTLYRESKGNFSLAVTRDTILLVTVESEMLDNSIGYISISMFDEHTADDFTKALKDLNSKGMKGLILDLRDNPGGLLNASVSVVSNFVEKGKDIVSTIDKYNQREVLTSEGGEAIGLPLVVLVNEYSASASEIVTGAIKDYGVGTIIGSTTFGKGIVQTVLRDKTDGTALKVTISKYYTPKGINIHGTGIAPDIAVDYPDELREQVYNRSTDPQFKKALEVILEQVK